MRAIAARSISSSPRSTPSAGRCWPRSAHSGTATRCGSSRAAAFFSSPFPRALGSGLSGFYLAIFLVLWVLILRGIANEFRSHVADRMWRSFWDGGFAFASTLAPVLFGCALGNLLRGEASAGRRRRGLLTGLPSAQQEPDPDSQHPGIATKQRMDVGEEQGPDSQLLAVEHSMGPREHPQFICREWAWRTIRDSFRLLFSW